MKRFIVFRYNRVDKTHGWENVLTEENGAAQSFDTVEESLAAVKDSEYNIIDVVDIWKGKIVKTIGKG